MPNYSRNIIITIGDLNTDPALRIAQANLTNKTNAETYGIDSLGSGSLKNLGGARIYLHGHGDFWNMTLGGLAPETIADKLVEAGLDTVKLISITGCNAARGIHCRQKLNAVWNNPQIVPGITERTIYEDSRLVDIQLSARTLCHGSIAQRFHKQLLDKQISCMVYARLFVVTIESDGKKRTMHADVWEDDGILEVTPCQHHRASRSKISITAQSGEANGQRFDFV